MLLFFVKNITNLAPHRFIGLSGYSDERPSITVRFFSLGD